MPDEVVEGLLRAEVVFDALDRKRGQDSFHEKRPDPFSVLSVRRTCQAGERTQGHAGPAVDRVRGPGTIEEESFRGKLGELRDEQAKVRESLDGYANHDPQVARAALAVFDWSQNAAEIWRGSKMAARREILETVSLNRMVGGASLVLEKRKPFDVLAERAFCPVRSG